MKIQKIRRRAIKALRLKAEFLGVVSWHNMDKKGLQESIKLYTGPAGFDSFLVTKKIKTSWILFKEGKHEENQRKKMNKKVSCKEKKLAKKLAKKNNDYVRSWKSYLGYNNLAEWEEGQLKKTKVRAKSNEEPAKENYLNKLGQLPSS